MCFYWVLLHMCKVCVCFFPGLDCMCMFFVTVRCMCALKALTLFFSLGMAPLLSAPQCPDPVTVPLSVLFFFPLNSVQQFMGSGFISPFYFFVYSEFITQIFPPLSFLPDSQAAAVPNSLALHFFKATFKNKLITHRPLMKSC